jgi:thioredoxin 1
MIKIFDETIFKRDLDTGNKLYVYFYSPSCGPCKTTSPLIEKFGNTTPNIVFTVNSTEGVELQKQLNVSAYPSLIIIHNNKFLKGGVGQSEIEKIIEDATSNK